jgi:hypothetical protein
VGVFLLFLLALSLGSLSTLFWIPEPDVGRGYFQMNALVILGLLGIAAAVVVLHPLDPYAARPAGAWALAGSLVAGFLYWGAIWRERFMTARAVAAAAAVACAAALALAVPALLREVTPLPGRSWLLAAGLASSALLLGWSLVTMLLGHWYLVSPRLTFRHLVVFCWTLLGIAALRAVLSGAALVAAAAVDPAVEPHPLRLLTSFSGEGMFFWFRWLWGLLGTLVLAGMALHCARRRANQSATGILYVLVVGCFVGEILGLYLTLATGIPV